MPIPWPVGSSPLLPGPCDFRPVRGRRWMEGGLASAWPPLSALSLLLCIDPFSKSRHLQGPQNPHSAKSLRGRVALPFQGPLPPPITGPSPRRVAAPPSSCWSPALSSPHLPEGKAESSHGHRQGSSTLPPRQPDFPCVYLRLSGALLHSYKANRTHMRLTQVLGSETLDLGVVGRVAPSWG